MQQEYDIIRPVASLATTQGGEEMGVYRRGDLGWEVSVETGERYENGRKKYYRELLRTKKAAMKREKELIEEFKQAMQQVVREEMQNLQSEEQPSETPFKDAAMEWLNSKRHLVKKTTYEGYRIITEVHLVAWFGKYRVAAINDTMINEYLAEKFEDLSSTTLRHHYSVLSMILRSKNNYCMLKIERPKVSDFEAQPIQKMAELKKLVKALGGVVAYWPSRVAALTGMRFSEIAALKWRDIDFEENTISIRRSLHWDTHKESGERYYYTTEPKTKYSRRTIAVSKSLTKDLKKLKNERRSAMKDDFVLLDQFGRPLNRHNIYDSFKKRVTRLGYQNLRFHDLRHSHATICINELGMDPQAVQLRLGHSSLTTTLSIYTAKSLERDRQIADEFDVDVEEGEKQGLEEDNRIS